jgi:hypothetical protein
VLTVDADSYLNVTSAVRYHGCPPASSTPQNSKYWSPAGNRPVPVRGATMLRLARMAVVPNHPAMLDV